MGGERLPLTDAQESFAKRLAAALPALQPIYGKLFAEEPLTYVFMGAISDYVLDLYSKRAAEGGGSDGELRALLSIIEQEYVRGDSSVRRLIEEGFLEGLGGPAERGSPRHADERGRARQKSGTDPPWRVRELLGPETRAWIEAYWPSGAVMAPSSLRRRPNRPR